MSKNAQLFRPRFSRFVLYLPDVALSVTKYGVSKFAYIRAAARAVGCSFPVCTLLFLLCSVCLSQSVDKEILDVLPKIKEAKNIVGLMDRDTLTFDVALQRTEDEVRQTVHIYVYSSRV